MDLVEFFENLH